MVRAVDPSPDEGVAGRRCAIRVSPNSRGAAMSYDEITAFTGDQLGCLLDG